MLTLIDIFENIIVEKWPDVLEILLFDHTDLNIVMALAKQWLR